MFFSKHDNTCSFNFISWFSPRFFKTVGHSVFHLVFILVINGLISKIFVKLVMQIFSFCVYRPNLRGLACSSRLLALFTSLVHGKNPVYYSNFASQVFNVKLFPFHLNTLKEETEGYIPSHRKYKENNYRYLRGHFRIIWNSTIDSKSHHQVLILLVCLVVLVVALRKTHHHYLLLLHRLWLFFILRAGLA